MYVLREYNQTLVIIFSRKFDFNSVLRNLKKLSV